MLVVNAGIGMILGPIAGGSLSKLVGYSSVGIVAGFGSLGVAAITFLFLGETRYVLITFI